MGDNHRALGLLAQTTIDGNVSETGYYEMGDKLELVRKEDAQVADFIRTKFSIPQQVISIEESSVLIVDDLGRRWRLPLGEEAYNNLTDLGLLHVCREVATERDLFSCRGTFYKLPAENADGYAKIRPVSSHPFHIHDYASYRGMLVLTGVIPEEGKENPHIIASDPYLIAFYDKKELQLSHQSPQEVTFTVEVDPTGNGDWMEYLVQMVKGGEKWTYKLPEAFQARWIRFSTNADVKATAWLTYK